MSERLNGNSESSSKAKVTDLDIALVSNKEILRFEVSVDDTLRVAVIDTTKELVDHFLNLHF